MRHILETRKRQLFEQRIFIVQGLFLFIVLLIVGRLLELQVVKGKDYALQAQKQQFGGVVLSAKRGEILGKNSKTGDESIFATNTTLDLLYIDPLVLKDHHADIADSLADILIPVETDATCRKGNANCPTELLKFYKDAFNPLTGLKFVEQPTGSGGYVVSVETGSILAPESVVPQHTEIKRLFARDIESRIQQKSVNFVPLLYSADKKQIADSIALNIPGIIINTSEKLIAANPNEITQSKISDIARTLSPILRLDPATIRARLIDRPLRYVPIMSRLSPEISKKIVALKEKYSEQAKQEFLALSKDQKKKTTLSDPSRALAILSEHRRFYPDTRIASHLIGFINNLEEPQYGIERSFDTMLKGQEGLIASVKDPTGGQILSADQTFINPEDGATIVLSIDRMIQSKVEELLDAMVKKVDAESGQVIVMDPFTGRILALANAPLFDSNSYASVYEKEVMTMSSDDEKKIVIEILNPENNGRIMKGFLDDITAEGRLRLSAETQTKLTELEKLYDLKDLTRYYYYLGDNNRREIFPTKTRGVWLKYKNNIGVGSYVNRAVQELYEPGSVMKPLTMAIAIDQGETVPTDIYYDSGSIKVDRFIIKNALNKAYGKVSMVDCMDFSINTCMTSISSKLGRKLFHAALDQLGFGKVTGIELDNELPGNLKEWKDWDDALVLTLSFGQGISVTPIQMATAFSTLANGGKLMKPTIIDEVRLGDGTVNKKDPEFIRQVFKPQTAETITGILAHGAQFGFAKAGKVPGYRIAGKTGTSQIAGPGGKYERGTGSTIATYAGYAPLEHPKFMILVKLDRPKKDDFGSKSAAPLFKDIAKFLFEYYGIKPDEGKMKN